MKKMKVYLAKSNRANPEVVARVRQTLSNYNLEIVEFKGGTYSHNSLIGCDQLVVVPEELDVDSACITVGKGLYEQIQVFSTKNLHNSDNIIFISDNSCNTAMIESYDIVDSHDYINYGEVYLSEDYCSLTDILEDVVTDYYCGSGESIYAKASNSSVSRTSSGSNYYHLIGRKV
jgi:hypothetical protein